MVSLHVARVAVTVLIRVSHSTLQHRSPASPEIIGGELAQQVSAYVQQEKLGYYPALDYFRDHGELDKDLLDAVEAVGWLASQMVSGEVRSRLRPVFSSLRFESIQTVAFTMPGVRPGDTNALHKLANHYTPDTVKLAMIVSLLQRHESAEAAQRAAHGLVCRWLADRFDAVDVTAATVLDA
ncbi:MAG: hypothetical protein JSW10_01570 [Pseudomonadota bacterium]|nr:MAG: hypothetical protein JSW10_01570 [Pseudomonadota bacterium]